MASHCSAVGRFVQFCSALFSLYATSAPRWRCFGLFELPNRSLNERSLDADVTPDLEKPAARVSPTYVDFESAGRCRIFWQRSPCAAARNGGNMGFGYTSPTRQRGISSTERSPILPSPRRSMHATLAPHRGERGLRSFYTPPHPRIPAPALLLHPLLLYRGVRGANVLHAPYANIPARRASFEVARWGGHFSGGDVKRTPWSRPVEADGIRGFSRAEQGVRP